mmetsp:Transcript_13875/g.19115  ORF Transcript_13875/g.19115 Transcript_13875/m.19115 type:complete len:260 (-) Transcript_13875:36-815(-)
MFSPSVIRRSPNHVDLTDLMKVQQDLERETFLIEYLIVRCKKIFKESEAKKWVVDSIQLQSKPLVQSPPFQKTLSPASSPASSPAFPTSSLITSCPPSSLGESPKRPSSGCGGTVFTQSAFLEVIDPTIVIKNKVIVRQKSMPKAMSVSKSGVSKTSGGVKKRGIGAALKRDTKGTTKPQSEATATTSPLNQPSNSPSIPPSIPPSNPLSIPPSSPPKPSIPLSPLQAVKQSPPEVLKSPPKLVKAFEWSSEEEEEDNE